MRVAALYDIHGNLPALEAVLHDLRRQGVDRIVVGGDVVPGPMSSEALDRVLDLGVPTDFIRGNGELAALAERAGAPSGVPEPHRDVVFCHATPRNENEIFTKLTREERLLEIFRGLDVTMVVCGHTHMQFDIV